MPIKLPKGFPRRKSSGNVLDETSNTESSFKVYSRPTSSGQALDTSAAQKKPLPVRKNSFEQEDDDLFTVARPGAANRRSRATDRSLGNTQYDSGASSSRLSTSSTNPSSIDTKSDKNVHALKEQSFNDIPVPPAHQNRNGGFLRNAGRTFSFGIKSQKGNPEPELPAPLPAVSSAGRHRFSLSNGRERATTASSIATTTPPRLLDSDLAIENSELDDFGNMFDGIGARASGERSPARLSTALNPSPYDDDHFYHESNVGNTAHRAAPPRSLYVVKSVPIESSPYSCTSDTSRDGLMRSPSPSKTVTQNSPQTAMQGSVPGPSRDYTLQQTQGKMDENLFDDTPNSARAYSRPLRQNAAPPPSYPDGARLSNPPQSPVTTTMPAIQSSPRSDYENPVFDASLVASAELASQYQAMKPPPTTEPAKKVMTPQQFERYKQQETERQRLNKAFGKVDSDESGDDYEDDDHDETERDRLAFKQRRKQEAHLAVYRQTMMKVTGEAAAPPNGRTSSYYGNNLSAGQPDMTNRLSSLNVGSRSSTNIADEDGDEDVPLGILAAHGFPNKNKPPSKLTASGSNPNLRGLAQSQVSPGSVAGESVNRSSLPAFARKLPEDPYYGAGLVSSSNRESLAFHSTTALLSPSGAHTNHPHHPAGLVGVIAGEERARAARRGSPSAATGQYDLPPSMPEHPGMVRSQTTGQIPTMMMPGMVGMPLSPGDQAQIQMSQQMTQMMQMQMQWMQQMQQFMGNRGPSPAGNMPGMPIVDPVAAVGLARPHSVPLQHPNEAGPRSMSTLSPNMANWNQLGPSMAHNGHTARTMSTLSPSMANWNQSSSPMDGRPGSAYAGSIAPSERSNVGLASRYRPVSTAQEPVPRDLAWQKRSSTMVSSLTPWSTEATSKRPGTQTIRNVVATADDDDDEAGWAEMKAKKDQKQKSWKLRKSNNPLQELYNGST